MLIARRRNFKSCCWCNYRDTPPTPTAFIDDMTVLAELNVDRDSLVPGTALAIETDFIMTDPDQCLDMSDEEVTKEILAVVELETGYHHYVQTTIGRSHALLYSELLSKQLCQ